MELLLLEPVFKQMIWGGHRLKDDFGYDIPGDNTGECWAISAHPHGDCTLKNTEYKGKTLSWLWENHRELFGNVQGDRFPLLIKIIDAKADLSIQVHPDDAYAAEHENGLPEAPEEKAEKGPAEKAEPEGDGGNPPGFIGGHQPRRGYESAAGAG